MLDTHTHLIPAGLESFVGVEWDGAKLTIDGHTLGVAALFKPQALLDWMAAQGVDHAWVSAPPPTYRQHLSEVESRAWCTAINDGIAAICAAHDNLTALPHLPVEHPALAAEIVAGSPARRFAMAAGDGMRPLSDPAFAPLWQALSGRVLLMHPADTPDPRLAPFYMENLVGNPQETGIAGAHLIMGGVLETYPEIRIILAHAGGTLPMIAGRLQHGWSTKRAGVDTTREAPLASARRLYADPMAHHPMGLELAAEIFGPDHIVFGSDWPFPMGILEPAKHLPDNALGTAIRARADITA
jgi:aminocarboxymuconate-semialdehyde decarboxylase